MENYKFSDHIEYDNPYLVPTEENVEKTLKEIIDEELISKILSPEDQMQTLYKAREIKRNRSSK
jgi:hypothetical protein